MSAVTSHGVTRHPSATMSPVSHGVTRHLSWCHQSPVTVSPVSHGHGLSPVWRVTTWRVTGDSLTGDEWQPGGWWPDGWWVTTWRVTGDSLTGDGWQVTVDGWRRSTTKKKIASPVKYGRPFFLSPVSFKFPAGRPYLRFLLGNRHVSANIELILQPSPLQFYGNSLRKW